MNYKRLEQWNSGFHDWVIRRHPTKNNRQNGFMGGFIYGKKGNGKSTYCYKAMAKIYFTLMGLSGLDDEETAYKVALDRMIFDGDLLIDLLIENTINEEVTPVLCLDDASMHFGTQLYKHNPALYDAMQGEIATVREVVTGFLITSPKRSMCAKFLRENDDYKGEALINAGSQWKRKIRFYEWREYPDERTYKIQIPFQDEYSCYIPDENSMGLPFYDWYIEKKRYHKIKHQIYMADKHRPKNRFIFIKLLDKDSEKIPREFHGIIKKWGKESM